MLKIFRFPISVFVVLAVLSNQNLLHAEVIFVSDKSPTTEPGQLHVFSFPELPVSDGTDGVLRLTMSGDFSPRDYPPLSEGVTVTLDSAGSFDLYNDSNGGIGFAANTVDGITVVAVDISGGGNDTMLAWNFSVDSSLIDSIVMDSVLDISVQSASDVAVGDPGDDHFIEVSMLYQAIPEPTAGFLACICGLALVGTTRKRSARW